MQRNTEGFISNNERDFIIKAVKEDIRIDGRGPYDYRKLNVQFALDDRSATVQLGSTTAMAAITAELTAPFQDRAREGAVRFNVELSPMASASFAAGRPGEGAIELARLVERCLKGSGALDMEALCVLPGRKVWSLRVDVHVLDSSGNLVDVCCLAALAALLGFRKPQVEVDQAAGEGEAQVIVHPPEVREPQPLTLHHLPLPHTFAIFEAGAILAADPNLSEEAAAAGAATLFMNPHGEVCGWQMAEGVGLDTNQMMRCVRLAAARSPELAATLQEALQKHELARVQARVRRHTGAAAAAAAAAGPGSLPGRETAAVHRGVAAAAAALGPASGGLGGHDPRCVTVLADTHQADDKLQDLMAEIRQAVARQHLQDEQLEQQTAAAVQQQPPAAAAEARGAVADAATAAFVRPPPLSSKSAPGVARLAGSTGNAKRAVDADASLDAFLGKSSTNSSSRHAGAGQYQSLDQIEQMLFQSAPQDLAAAVKPKKKHKKKSKQDD